MNPAQRIVVVTTLLAVGAALALVFLEFGEGAFSNVGGDRIAILVLSGQDRDPMFGSGYGLYTMKGIPGILLGLIAPMCLLASAAFIAFGSLRNER